MNFLLVINGIFFALTLLGFFVVARGIRTNRTRAVLNELISDELQIMVDATEKNLHARAPIVTAESYDGPMDLGDPALLSTLITVIINKIGSVKLNLDDFEAVPENEFVSVYIDSTTSDLILSLNHDLESKEPMLANFYKGDDDVFH
tara:strand:+ start:32 stop:472 length:441 start_codon:yes stop_codon:yes gene_type:complete